MPSHNSSIFEPFHVPARVFQVVNAVVIFLTFTFALYAWWTIGEAPTAARLSWYMWPVLEQLAVAGLLSWAMRHPQHLHLPFRINWSALSARQQHRLHFVIEHFVAVFQVLVSLLLALAGEGLLLARLHQSVRPATIMTLGVLGILFFFVGASLIVLTKLSSPRGRI